MHAPQYFIVCDMENPHRLKRWGFLVSTFKGTYSLYIPLSIYESLSAALRFTKDYCRGVHHYQQNKYLADIIDITDVQIHSE